MAHIFSFMITTYLKKRIGIKSLSTKQSPAELSPLYPPSYQKCITSFHLACCPCHVWTALPLPSNLPFGRNPVDGGRISSSSKKMSISLIRKIPLTNTSFIYSCSHCCCIIFLTSGFMCRYIMLILISRRLVSFICSMTKALNEQNSSKQNSQTPSLPFTAICKTLLQLLLALTLINLLIAY